VGLPERQTWLSVGGQSVALDVHTWRQDGETMSDNGKYFDQSWNPITRCSNGGPYCWARELIGRFSHLHGDSDFSKIMYHPERLEAPKKRKKPTVYFVCDLGALFGAEVEKEWITKVFNVITETPQHTYLVLTKQAERMFDYMTFWEQSYIGFSCLDDYTFPLDNLWFGVSVTNQQDADERIPYLLQVPGKRWVSYKPAKGPVDFFPYLTKNKPVSVKAFEDRQNKECYLSGLGQIVARGQTGRDATPAYPDWFRSVRDQCHAAGVPFFFEHWGEWAPLMEVYGGFKPVPLERVHVWYTSKPGHWDGFSLKVGKKAAGRLLDGREHNEIGWKNG